MKESLLRRIRSAQEFLATRAEAREERGWYEDAEADRSLAEWFKLVVILDRLPDGLDEARLEELIWKLSECESAQRRGVG